MVKGVIRHKDYGKKDKNLVFCIKGCRVSETKITKEKVCENDKIQGNPRGKNIKYRIKFSV